MLDVSVEYLDDSVILCCHGKIVRGAESAILCAALRHYQESVILDLSQVDTIDAAGVGALIALQTAGIYLKLANPNLGVRNVLRITGLESVFEIFETPLTQPAIASLGSEAKINGIEATAS